MAHPLAYVTGMVNQQFLLQNEYLRAENRILRAHLPTRFLLSDPQRPSLVVIGKRLGRRGLETVAAAPNPRLSKACCATIIWRLPRSGFEMIWRPHLARTYALNRGLG